MKNLLILLLVLPFLVQSCIDKRTTIEGSDIANLDYEVESRDDELQDAVCNLLTEAYNAFDATSLESYFSSQMWDLLSETPMSQWSSQDTAAAYSAATDALDDLFTNYTAFESYFNDVLALATTEGEFFTAAGNCTQPRGCWICNEKACAVTHAVEITGVAYNDPETILLGWLGQFIHCD